MKTRLIHSYSSSSLSNLSRSPSNLSLAHNNGYTTSTSGLVNEDIPGEQEILPDDDNCLVSIAKNVFKRKLLLRKFPILQWIREYNSEKLVADFIAGLTVGLTILPQGLAYATIAGVPPQYGLYSGFIGCFVYILFGSSPIMTIGPTAIMSIITLSYSAGKPPEYAVLLCLTTGVVTLLMGIFQLGVIVELISTPVCSAFTSAAALTICSTQIQALLGLKYKADGVIAIVIGAIEHISECSVWDSTLSLVCIAVLLCLQNLQAIFKCCTKNWPKLDKILWLISTSRSVIVIVVCTIIVSFLGDPSPVRIVGSLTPGLPPVHAPQLWFTATKNGTLHEYSLLGLLKSDGSALIVIPLLALMEHITIAKAFAGTNRVDANQEMISIGLSNLIGCFFQSIPVTGSFSRSTVNAASGAKSPMGGLVTGTLVILSTAFLSPYFYYIPKSSLAAVIVCAVIFTVDFRITYAMWHSKRMDLIPWCFTFVISLLCGLEYGILTGFVISVVFLLFYAARPGVRVRHAETSTGVEFILVDLDRSLVFPSVEYIRYVVMKSGSNWGRGQLPVVVDCRHIQFADFTAAQGVRDLFKVFNQKEQELILWQVKPSIVRILGSVMDIARVPFKHCSSEAELEALLERLYLTDIEKDNNIKITFTLAPSSANGNDHEHVQTQF